MFDNIARALKIAPLLKRVSDEQFNFILYLSESVSEINEGRIPIFVFSEEQRIMLHAIGIKGHIVVVSRSESYMLHSLLNAKSIEEAEAIVEQLIRLESRPQVKFNASDDGEDSFINTRQNDES